MQLCTQRGNVCDGGDTATESVGECFHYDEATESHMTADYAEACSAVEFIKA